MSPPGGRDRPVEAIFFDLYGTLLEIPERRISRALPRLLGIPARAWVELVRTELLIRPFPDREAFLERLLEAAPGSPPAVPGARELVDEELASIVPCPGALHVLRFLKRRGHALGLVSNLTAIHEEPVRRHGLEELFDGMALSFREGIRKPDRRIYLRLCERLDVEPGAVLFVGDSLANDVRAPRELGMRALRIDADAEDSAIRAVDRLGWLGPLHEGTLEPLVSPGSRVRLGGRGYTVGSLEPLDEAVQGRYNLVARVEPPEGDEGDERRPFCKRFRHPASARIEAFAREIMAVAGLPCGDAAILRGPEPCLLMTPAPGEKLDGVEAPDLAREVGRQCAAGYLFANADLRPRNAFVHRAPEGPRVTMIDLELMFFNLALDVDGLEDPFRPATWDALSEDEVAARLRHRVLNHRTTRRAMRSFVVPESPDSELGRAFRAGWVEIFRRVDRRRDDILGRIRERVVEDPPLIIGTRAYRRAMARIDVDDIESRIDEDPERLFPRLATFRDRRR